MRLVTVTITTVGTTLFDVPDDVDTLYLDFIAGGGGGGGGQINYQGAGYGGGAGSRSVVTASVSPGSAHNVVVGTGGTGGLKAGGGANSGNGYPGTSSYITGLVTTTGGAGAGWGYMGSPSPQSSGLDNFNGEAGASSYFDAGGWAGIIQGVGFPATIQPGQGGTGAGGGGGFGSENNDTARASNGAAGGRGKAIISYYSAL
jgi:hypothetical protein